MTSYIPKYQFQAISARRSGKGRIQFKYQVTRKDGSWGAVRTGDNSRNNGTPEEIVAYWESINPGKKFRLVEA